MRRALVAWDGGGKSALERPHEVGAIIVTLGDEMP